ncbi:MAG: hypothetical protein KIT43_05955 [Bauldia sp.]|nr:hypothetical protein [Bauldia sp.]
MLAQIGLGIAALALLIAGVVQSRAATEAEWQAFRADVEAKCLAAADGLFETATAIVDPFGSQTYGMALIRGRARGADVSIMAICVYDKVTQVAEIGGELPDIGAPPASGDGPMPDTLAWATPLEPCATECAAALAPLVPADADGLRALPVRVATTLAAIADPALPMDEGARGALATTVALGNGDLAAIATGDRTCTVYWYGFLDNAGQTVGQHRCRVTRGEDGMLTVEKLSGEMMHAQIAPVADGTGVAVGRTFLEGHAIRRYDPATPDNAENANFGNFVGLAFADGARLVVVDADVRGMSPPDDTYFAVLVVE